MPALHAGVSAAELAQQVAERGIVPKTVGAYSTAKRGTVFATKPPAGTELKAGDTLDAVRLRRLPRARLRRRRGHPARQRRDRQAAQPGRERPAAREGPDLRTRRQARRLRGGRPGVRRRSRQAGCGAEAADHGHGRVHRPRVGVRPRLATSSPWPGRPATPRAASASGATPQRLVSALQAATGARSIGRAIHWSRDGRDDPRLHSGRARAAGHHALALDAALLPRPARLDHRRVRHPRLAPRAGARSTPRSRPTARRSPWRRTSDPTASASI